MLLWRLSGREHALTLNGGYGLLFDGRWNTIGHAVTYCATSPSLCVLEKLVHIEDPRLLPELVMLTYELPDDTEMQRYHLNEISTDWRANEAWTQKAGDDWHEANRTPLLCVPSAIVPIPDSPDMNVIINHAHPASSALRIIRQEPFTLDPRLF